MASRDRSQGFGFIYVDIQDVLAQRHELRKAEANNQPIPQPAPTQSINMNRDEHVRRVPAPVAKPEPDVQADRTVAMQQIRENLDRLQSLHHKLHAMLEELNKVTGKKR